MPATEAAMGTPSTGSSGTPGAPGGMLTNGWASATVLGGLTFGIMTMLLGLFYLPAPYGKGFEADLGLITIAAYAAAGILLLVGLTNLMQGHLFWGTAFTGFAAFWGTWGYAFHHFAGSFALTSPVWAYGFAGFLFLWMLVTFTFLLSSIKHGWGTFFAWLFLFVGIILVMIDAWQTGAANTISKGEQWAIGGELIFTGLIWWYGATASLTNHSFGKKFLPT